MRNKIITIFLLSIFYLSCYKNENKFYFSINNQLELEKELKAFIDSIHSANNIASEKFCNDTVKWWNISYNGQFTGFPGIITKDISLSWITGLQHLTSLKISVSGDTINGLINVEKWKYPDNTTGMDNNEYCLDTNYIKLVLKNGRINEIINYEQHPGLKGVVKIECFYMDENMVNNFEYVPEELNQKQKDSILHHWNDFNLITTN